MKKLFLSVFVSGLLALGARADLPPMPQPTTSFGAVTADGYLYAYGGNTGKEHEFNNEVVKGDFFRARLPSGQWENLGEGEKLLSPAIVEYKGKIILVGGLSPRNKKGEPDAIFSTDAVKEYDPATKAWKNLPAMPQPRSSHDVAVVGDSLIAGGGWRLEGKRTGEWYKTALILDLTKPEAGWKEIEQPFQRRAIAAVYQGGKVWFIGGMDNHDDMTGEVDWYEPATGKWGKGPAMPKGPMEGFGMSACVQDGKVYISPVSGVVSVLNAEGTAWETAAKLKEGRFFARVVPGEPGKLLVLGGSVRGRGRPAEVEVVDLKAQPVTEKAPEPAPAKAAQAPVPAPPVPSAAAAAVDNSIKTASLGWPQWRGPGRDGLAEQTGWLKQWPAEGPTLAWRAKVGEGMSSPVVSEGKVLLHGSDGEGTDTLAAYALDSGKEVWRYSYPSPPKAHQMPIVPNGPAATPTIAGGFVFFLSREGTLAALTLAEGKLVWQKRLVEDLGGKRPVYGFSQSPLVEDGRLYVDLGAEKDKEGSTAALNAATGEVIWKTGTGEAGYSSGRLFTRDGQRLLAMLKGEALEVMEAANGKVLWRYPITVRDFANAVTPSFLGHQVLISNTNIEGAVLLDWDFGPNANVREVWKQKQLALLFNSPIYTDGSFFAFNEKRRGHNEFTCLDPATGEARWVSDAVPTGTFILADGHWLFLTRDGEVMLAPAMSKELKPTARFKAVEGKCYATLALAEGRLIARSNTGEVAVFDLRPESKKAVAAR